MKEPVKETLHYDPKRECGSGGCLGELFPDFLRLVPNVINRGRVFGVLIESHGLGAQRKEIVRDEAAWKKCLDCSQFDRCLQVSMAKLSLQQAVGGY
ncbi:MAG: hypothetical protein ABS95_00420 [Verrucomicrobia bacterium SCN 57-15]|nr:MAG: hypothetical protein ABS95_00420 [Verrucomicrobia bacterium SCN 57-15]